MRGEKTVAGGSCESNFLSERRSGEVNYPGYLLRRSVMRATCKILLVLGLTALLTGPALAQGQRKGGFGRGGFGGGGPAQLVRNKSVQQELKLTDDQVKKAETAAKEVNDKHQSDRDALRDLEGQE